MPKAVIFDMDGVISDTQRIYSEVESLVAREFGLKVAPEYITANYSGMGYEVMFADLLSRFSIKADLSLLCQETRKRAIERITSGSIRPIPGALELVNECSDSGFLLAVASTSRHIVINHILDDLGIKNKFHAIASGEEVKNKKPDPEIFLLAAERLGVQPEHSVVIEDSLAGMRGAKSAGMKCVGLLPAGADPKDYPADFTINSLLDLSVEKLKKMFA